MSEESRHVSHENKSDSNGTIKLKKSTLWIGAAAILGILLVASIITGGFGFGNKPEVGKTRNLPVQDAAPPAEVKVEIGDSPVKGADDAPVTMMEFADFQCPFCGRFYSDTLPAFQESYIDTGNVKFVFKHFPLDSIHPQAVPAALASECAKEQGKFWEYHDIIFQNQQLLSGENYERWAVQLGLDKTKFNDCYDSQKYLSRVASDVQQGNSAGVRGTPGFLINGQLVSGAQPFSVFQQIIEAELAN